MKNPFGGSLAGKLRLSSLAVVVPLLILAGIIVYQTWAVRPQEALRDSLELAVEGSHQMDDFLVRTGKVLVALAHVPEIEDIKPDEATSMLQNLSQHFPEYESFFLANSKGRVVASAHPEIIGNEVADRSYFQEAMVTKDVAVSGVITSTRTGRRAVVAAYPVISGDGLPRGVVAASLVLEDLPLALSRVQLEQEYRLTVFDREGQVVFQTGPAGVAFAPVPLCSQCHASPAPTGALHTKAWVGEGQEFHALATTSLGWHVVVNAPSGAILGRAQAEAWAVLGAMVAILITSLVVTAFLGRRLASPILRLAEASRRFGAGERVPPLPVTTGDEIGLLTECFNSMVGDIQESRRRLEERQARLNALHELDRAISSTLSLPAVLGILADEVQGLASVEGVAIYLLEENGGLNLINSRGSARPMVTGDGKEKWEDLARRALAFAGPVAVDAPLQPCAPGGDCSQGGCLGVAVSARGQTLGAILFCTGIAEGFSPEEQEFLHGVALQASAAVDNARLYGLEQRRVAELESISQEMKRQRDELRRAQEGIVETLNLSLQAKDPYTRGHADRVSLLARRIAGRLGLPRERQEVLARAARLHDIGKISIPENLLDKEGPLTPPERTQFELHPERSAELLRHLPDLDQVLPAIRGHHERYDGKGYPDGLAGQDIPLEARIIAVADSYDALTTDRPYRKGLSHEEALVVLRANAGTQWDPQVVQVMLEIFEEEEITELGRRALRGPGASPEG